MKKFIVKIRNWKDYDRKWLIWNIYRVRVRNIIKRLFEIWKRVMRSRMRVGIVIGFVRGNLLIKNVF